MHLFLISLPDPPQRRQSAVTKLKDAGLGFEIVDGVDARKWRFEELPIAEDASDGFSVGEVGCYLAHLRALRRLVDYGLKWACILEDDFCFESDPDIGLSDLDASLPEEFHYLHLQRDLNLNPNYKIVERCGLYNRIEDTPLCATGYVITRPLAEFVLNHHSHFAMPIDHLYSKLSYQGRFFAAAKPLVGIQTGLPSVIRGY